MEITHYLIAAIIGFLVAFVGLMPPAMLNMTAAGISIERGKRAGIIFSAGAALVIIFQAGIAVYFSKFLVANPQIIEKLKISAIFVMFGLAIFFFFQARKKNKIKTNKQNKGNFIKGILMSSLNMMSIPYYLAMAIYAESESWMKVEMPDAAFYVVGATVGAFLLFAIYAYFAETIAQRVNFIAQNINYILSALFAVLALIIAIGSL